MSEVRLIIANNLGEDARGNLRSMNECFKNVSANEIDRPLQKDEKGVIYIAKQRGFLGRALVKVAIRVGDLFKIDLRTRLRCPSDDRAMRVSKEFNELVSKLNFPVSENETVTVGRILKTTKDVIDEKVNNRHFPDFNDILAVAGDIKAELNGFVILQDDLNDLEGQAAETFASTNLDRSFLQNKECRTIYNLVLAGCCQHYGCGMNAEKAERYLQENNELLNAVAKDSSLAVDLCEIDKAIKDTVRGLGILSRNQDSFMHEMIVDLFHPKLLAKDLGSRGNYNELRHAFFSNSLKVAFLDLQICKLDDCVRTLSILSGLTPNRCECELPGISDFSDSIVEELEGTMYLINDVAGDKRLVPLFREIVHTRFLLLCGEDFRGNAQTTELTDLSKLESGVETVPKSIKEKIAHLVKP